MSDEDLISRIREGQEEAMVLLLERYKPVVKHHAKVYYIQGGDRDDLIQEGMIGLYKAITTYDPGQGTDFDSFAGVLILRQILTAVRSAARKKHEPLNSAVSLDQTVRDDLDLETTLVELLASSRIVDPQEIYEAKETKKTLLLQISESLSTFEKEVLQLCLMGQDYQEVAEVLDRTPKSVDNALQRIRTKVRRIINKS